MTAGTTSFRAFDNDGVPDPITLHVPWATSDERLERQRLLRARDRATVRLCHAQSDHARASLWMVVENATAWVFASATLDELRAARWQCIRFLQCAQFAEGW